MQSRVEYHGEASDIAHLPDLEEDAREDPIADCEEFEEEAEDVKGDAPCAN